LTHTDDTHTLHNTAESPALTVREWWQSILREILETAVITLFIFFVVQMGVQNYKVLGSSMEPNLHQGQYLLVNKVEYRLRAPARGDIIVFHYPNNPSDDYVKRVIGLPGEKLEVRDGRVFVNSVALEEPYLRGSTMPNYSGEVPADTVFVMGDNRGNSSDSRAWGALPQKYIVGRAVLCYWPPEQWAVLPSYGYAMP